MNGYVVVVAPVRDYGSERRVEVDCFYQLEYMKYFDKKEDITRVWNLFAKDFTKLEKFKKMPANTIQDDMSTVNGMQMRARFALGDTIMVYGNEEWTRESLETFLNSMEGSELKEFIDDAKI